MSKQNQKTISPELKAFFSSLKVRDTKREELPLGFLTSNLPVISQCDLPFENVAFMSVDQKKSASRTLMATATFRGVPCILKFSFTVEDPVGPNYPPLEAELKVYELLTTYQRMGAVLNVAPLLAAALCNGKNVSAGLHPQNAVTQWNIVSKTAVMTFLYSGLLQVNPSVQPLPTLTELADDLPVRTLAVRQVMGPMLDEYLRGLNGSKPNDGRLLQFLFQLIYTLGIMNSKNIRHGDIHLGNIRIQPIAKSLLAFNPDPVAILSDPNIFLQNSTALNDGDRDALTRAARTLKLANVAAILTTPQISEEDLSRLRPADRQSVVRARSEFQNPLNSWFVLETDEIPMMYDFDWGGRYIPTQRGGIPNEIALRECWRISSCSSIKADVYTLLAMTYGHCSRKPTEYPQTLELIRDSVKQELLDVAPEWNSYGGQPYRYCLGPFSLDDDCSLNKNKDPNCVSLFSAGWNPPDCLVQTPWNILRHRLFSEWRRPSPPPNSSRWGGWGVALPAVRERILNAIDRPRAE